MKALNTIPALMKAHDFSGVVSVSIGGEVAFSSERGFAHRGLRVENTMDTRFRVASIGKMITAVAILQLVDEGALSADQSIVSLLGLEDTTIADEVSIDHLLSHTSGIADWAEEATLTDETWEQMWRERPIYTVRSLSDYLPLFTTGTPNFVPGERYQYSNAGFMLLGLAIEKVTGIRYFDAIASRVLRLAGMSDSGFVALDDVGEGLAEGYGVDGSGRLKKNIYLTTPEAGADGGAVSTVADIVSLLRNLRSGKLLSRSMTERMLTPVVPWSDDEVGYGGYIWHYGHGLMFNLAQGGAIARYGHTG